MTDENWKLRDKISKIENMALTCLHGQPFDDAACEEHLKLALAKMADECAEFLGMRCVEAYDIEWDFDGEDAIPEGLPEKSRFVMRPESIESDIADRISDRFGWCVKSCKWRIV